MDLADIRQAIDGIDATLLNSFVERMDIATEVAKSKIEMGKAVFDPARERSKLNNLAGRAPSATRPRPITLFRLLMSMSKAEQQRYINELKGITISQRAHATAEAFDTPFPQTATVACQGVEGAYSQIAACKLFDVPDIAFFETFEGVMRAVRDGFCEFGVLPIENSTAGSVNAVYDLLAQFDFHIVRSLRLKIDHNLLVKPGAKLADVHEVYSHGQAIAQCAGFIEAHDLHATKYPNTAMSAEMVAQLRTHRCCRDRIAQLRRTLRPGGTGAQHPGLGQQLHALCRHQPRATRLPRRQPHLAHDYHGQRAGRTLSRTRALLRAQYQPHQAREPPHPRARL